MTSGNVFAGHRAHPIGRRHAAVTAIAPSLKGPDPARQAEIDSLSPPLDGPPIKARLGANAIPGVSMAVARAAAQPSGFPLYACPGGKACERNPPVAPAGTPAPLFYSCPRPGAPSMPTADTIVRNRGRGFPSRSPAPFASVSRGGRSRRFCRGRAPPAPPSAPCGPARRLSRSRDGRRGRAPNAR
ncbi:MAG: hypothetical protein F8N37_19875 [Telmatospirillum sp.]|nr:hypothetical protein [Telmatospirillum sp.]